MSGYDNKSQSYFEPPKLAVGMSISDFLNASETATTATTMPAPDRMAGIQKRGGNQWSHKAAEDMYFRCVFCGCVWGA